MQAKTILLEALETRWKKLCMELKTFRKDFSEEAVHDLRVAVRRLLAVFDLLRSIIPHKRIQKVRRILKDQLDELDDLRDVQVLLADAAEFVNDIPELKTVREHWLQEEKKLMRLTRKLVKTRDDKNLSKRVQKIRDMVRELPEEHLAGQMLTAADEAYARVTQLHSMLDAENIPGIHKLRIAFKKFRYSVEIVHPLLESFPSENFERMHDYQSRMGDIQDMEVARQKLTELNPASISDLEPVSAHYASRLRTAVLNFLEDKGEPLIFWRSSPNEPFPWENNS
ncbi:MAG: hypothetical protein Fur0017_27690 [Anaerolineales bacterium]